MTTGLLEGPGHPRRCAGLLRTSARDPRSAKTWRPSVMPFPPRARRAPPGRACRGSRRPASRTVVTETIPGVPPPNPRHCGRGPESPLPARMPYARLGCAPPGPGFRSTARPRPGTRVALEALRAPARRNRRLQSELQATRALLVRCPRARSVAPRRRLGSFPSFSEGIPQDRGTRSWGVLHHPQTGPLCLRS